MRARWFILGFLAGVLLSFVVYYSALHTAHVLAKTEPPAIPAVNSPAATSAIAPPIAGLKRSELRDSFNETHFGHRHEAIDIMEPRGTPILAVTDGVIVSYNARASGGSPTRNNSRSCHSCNSSAIASSRTFRSGRSRLARSAPCCAL